MIFTASLLIESQNAAFEREPDQVRLILQAQFAHHIRAMAFGGAGADEEAVGDLGAGAAFGHHLQDLALSCRQHFVGVFRHVLDLFGVQIERLQGRTIVLDEPISPRNVSP